MNASTTDTTVAHVRAFHATDASEVRDITPHGARTLATRWTGAMESAARGTWPRGRRWHVFSYGAVPSFHGARARAAYATQPERTVFVLLDAPELWRTVAFECELTGALPDLGRVDALVFPPSLAWTMAFTHESEDVGPFFAEAPGQTNPSE